MIRTFYNQPKNKKFYTHFQVELSDIQTNNIHDVKVIR